MDSYQYGELLKTLQSKYATIGEIIKPSALQDELAKLEALESTPNFWEDAKKASEISKQKTKITKTLQSYTQLGNNLNDSTELFELASAQGDSDTLELLFVESSALESSVLKAELEILLNSPNDALNAIITIQPGAGGTEAQDWASMLYRMYLRWPVPRRR